MHQRPQAPGSPSVPRPLPRPRLAPRRVAHTEAGPFPDDAPGTGRRRFPDEPTDCAPPSAPPFSAEERHEMKSTREAYRDFPSHVRSSFPLYVKTAGEQEPLGEVESRLEDAGPATHNRRRPQPVDPAPPQGPRVPAHPETQAERQREVLSRKGC